MNRTVKYCWISLIVLTLTMSAFAATTLTGATDNPGSLMQWHKVTLTFDGPNVSESVTTFANYRLDVKFTGPGGQVLWVPGYFAADGNAANSSATGGNKWRVHLSPDQAGTWSYEVAFRTGSNVAFATPESHYTGSSAGYMDGETGTFTVASTNKAPDGLDFRGKGWLQYVNKHHLRFKGSGEYFIKGGADAPENTLSYTDFDSTDTSMKKSWSPHSGHYDAATASAFLWKTNKGKNLMGAIKYLSDTGSNSFSFLTFTVPAGGDDKTVSMYVNSGSYNVIDISRMDQWDRIFEYADKIGMYMHFKLGETENDHILGNASTNNRRLYYREMIARFAYHLALNWNVGEEYSQSTSEAIGLMDLLDRYDPYDHNIVIHTYPSQHSQYSSYLGNLSKLTGCSLQISNAVTSSTNVFNQTKTQIDNSASANGGVRPWVVACDEQGPATTGVDCTSSSQNNARKNTLWGNIMAGGAGVEYYYGYQICTTDLNSQDHTNHSQIYQDTGHAIDFFMARDDVGRKPVPFHNMSNADGRVSGSSNHCLYGVDDQGHPCLVIYAYSGGSFTVNTPAATRYNVGWFNTRNGSWQIEATIHNHSGGTLSFTAPDTNDWALLLYNWDAVIDNDPPTPDPAQWQTPPTVVDDNTITMTAVTGADTLSEPVQYYFMETSGNCGASDSGWQTDPTFTPTGLAPGTEYCYSVMMQDARGNETGASSEVCVTTTGVADTTAPSPNPSTFEIAPVAVSSSEVTMTATLTTDVNGPVEYYFDETSGNPGASDSGWQTSRTYTDTGLSSGFDYTYTVKARDGACNETTASGPESAFTPIPQIVELPFGPTDDVYLESGSPFNTTELRVEPGTRISYLKFNVTGIPAGYDVTGVTLAMTENGDPGDGTLRFHIGSHNNWTETTITSGTAPAAGAQVGSRAGAVNAGQKITVDVTPLVTGNGIVSMVVMMDSGGNDIWFGSSESGAKAPVLTVTAESTGPADEDAPTPDPAEIESAISTDYSATITAAEGTDVSLPIQYYFEETSGNFGADDSGWQVSRTYVDEGLAPGTEYVYTVKMRDAAGNQTAASTPVAITTTGTVDNDPPTPNPAQFSAVPKANDQSSISMTAQTGLDANGPVEYYFAETSGNAGADDSGWQTSPSYTDTGLDAGTMYTYTVTVKDILDHVTIESTPVSTYTLGIPDLTGEGYVDFEDLQVLALKWLMTDCLNNNLCDGADMDVSNTVDLGDFSMISQNWLESLEPDQLPYNDSPQIIPGRIEAEAYDVGGEDISYHDTSVGNTGGEFRNDDVDIQTNDGGYNVGWITDGEWLEYTVNAASGVYELTARVATIHPNSSFTVWLDETQIATINIPVTGDWNTFVDVTVPVTIVGGDNVIMRLEFSCPTGGQNINWLEFTRENSLHLKMDEAGGSTASDSSGNGFDGTCVNMDDADWIAGKFGNALDFDGVDDYVAIDGFKGITGSASRTCMAWIKTTEVSGEIITWGSEEGNGKRWIIRVNEGGQLRAEVQGGNIIGTTVINDGQWHHIAVVLEDDGSPDINEAKLYVDGQLETISASVDEPVNCGSDQDVQIGVYTAAQRYFQGQIDDVQIYDQALGYAEIFQIVNLTAYLKMDEAGGSNASDSSGNGFDGTCVNMDDADWIAGKFGNALDFDGVDDYVAIDGFKGITGSASRTCMAWIKTTEVSGEIITWGSEEGNGKRWIIRVNEGGQLRAEVQGGNIIGTTVINDGQWHHIAVVLEDDGSPDINEAKLYVDGQLETISASVDEPVNCGSDQDVQIGVYTAAQRYFQGQIDDVQIYDQALTPALIAELAGEGGGSTGQTYVLDATADFPNINAGDVPAYVDTARDALAIDAASYKDQWAAAQTTFTGLSGVYDFKLVALTETDGESSYLVKINGVNIGPAKQNPYEGPGGTDYVEVEHVWPNISISSGATIQVWFNTHTNGDIPEGGGTAYSRGRWRRLILDGGDGTTNPTTGTYLESGGLVVMECENTETPQSEWGDWELVEPGDSRYVSGATNDQHIEFTGNTINGGDPKNPLLYTFQISEAGTYYLHIRARKRLEGQPSDKCNDCYVKMAGDFTSGNPNASLSALKTDTKLYGGNATNWGWASNLDSHDADHTPCAYNFKAGETYTLTVSGRSIRFNIDRIVLRRSSVSTSYAQDASRPESDRVN